MRHIVVVLLSCALFSAVLLVNQPSEAYADTGQAAVDQAYAYLGAPYGVGGLVFFDEHGYGVSHVGIATGDGTMIHSSTYYGAVVEAPIDSVPGYIGAVDVY